MLKITHLRKSFYKNQCILKDINLNISRGDVIYIKGINGSGKTTLFKIICDILEKDGGEIDKNKNLKIGALIENPSFIENETILFNLYFLASLNNNYNYEAIKKLTDLFSLDIHNKSKMKTYSLGMRQKVAIIQAVMENQNLIIFDEPVRGLDKKSIQTFIDLINALCQQGKAIIIASHDEIHNINYTHIYTLKDGKLYAESND